VLCVAASYLKKLWTFSTRELGIAKLPPKESGRSHLPHEGGAVKGELQHPTTTIMWRVNSRSQLPCGIHVSIALISQATRALISIGLNNDLANIHEQLRI